MSAPTIDDMKALVQQRLQGFQGRVDFDALAQSALDILADPRSAWMKGDPMTAVKVAIARANRP